MDADGDVVVTGKTVELSLLRALTITVFEEDPGDDGEVTSAFDCLIWLTRCFEAPNLTSLHLSVLDWVLIARPVELPDLFPIALKQIRTLSFEVRVSDFGLFADEEKVDPLSEWIEAAIKNFAKRIQYVEELRIDLPGLIRDLPYIPDVFRELRSLHVDGWHDTYGSAAGVESLIDKLQERAVGYESIQALTIVSCSGPCRFYVPFGGEGPPPEATIMDRTVAGAQLTWKQGSGEAIRLHQGFEHAGCLIEISVKEKRVRMYGWDEWESRTIVDARA